MEAGVWAYLRLCASDTQLFSGGDGLWLDWTSETTLLSLTLLLGPGQGANKGMSAAGPRGPIDQDQNPG